MNRVALPHRLPRSRSRTAPIAEMLESRRLLSGAIFQTSNSVTTSDNSGPVISSPHTILVFWGSNWGNGTATPAQSAVQNAVTIGLHSFYLSDLSGYRGFGSFGGGYIDRTVTITSSSPAASFTGANVAAMLQTNINNGVLPRPNVDANYYYLVVAQNGTTSPGANGAHSFASDNQSHKFHYGWTTNNGNIDFVANTLSHEIVEAMTDAEGDAIQVNPRNGSSWNEVSDGTAQNYSAWWQGVQLQSYWLQSRQAYIVPFGSMDIDATGGPGGTITVNGDQGGVTNDNITINKDTVNNRIQITINNQSIAFAIGNGTSQFQSVKVNAKDGNDTIAIGIGVDFPVTVDGGNGYDTVYYLGTEGNDNVTFNGTKPTGNGFDPYFSTGIEEFDVTTFGGADTITVNDCNRNMSLIGGSGDNIYYINSFTSGNSLTIYGGSNNDNVILGYSSGDIASNITNISSLRFYGNGGGDQFQPYNINASGNWTYALNPGSVTVSSDTGYFLTAQLDQIQNITVWGDVGNDSFTMSAGSTYSLLALGNNGNDTFDIRGGSSAALYGGYGDDTFIFGGGNLLSAASNVTANGEQGFDTMVLDDHLSTHNLPWAIYGNSGNVNTANTVFLGANAYSYSSFEGVSVLGGNGNNQFQIHGTSAATTLNGGGGNDDFLWLTDADNVFNNGFTITTYPMFLDGGSGFNTLSVNDSTHSLTSYDIYADRVRDKDVLSSAWSDYNYDNMGAIGITANSDANSVRLYGVSSDIPAGQQMTILLGGGNDTVTVSPHDANGNLTINGNVGIGGGSGTDSLTFDDTGATSGINYSFSNPFGAGTQDVFGVGLAGLGAGSDLENLIFKGGEGDDTFTLNSFKTGQSLSIFGNGGSDSVNWTPTSRDTVANVTSISYFSFDGGDGYDYLNFFNDNNASAWNYYRTSTAFSPYRASGGYYLILNDPNVEATYATGGAGNDQVFVQQVRPGGAFYVDGAGGNDNYFLSNAQSTQDIQGLVGIYATAGTDSVSIDDRADTVGRTVHIATSTVGAAPGDDLFGPGGSLSFSGIYGAMTLKLGSGADTVYVVPNPLTPIFIEGNDPAPVARAAKRAVKHVVYASPLDAGADSVNLALASAVNPVFTAGAPGEGAYSFDNASGVYFSGMEAVNEDAVAPTVLSASYNWDSPGPSVSFVFSEDVSLVLSGGYFDATNTSTGEHVPAGYIQTAWDAGTNTATFTFPGYANGALPDGNYYFELFAGLQDQFGNTLADPSAISDFALGGDANHDRTVDVTDLGILATNWQASGKAFSEGDFSYDGTVDVTDLGILATNWQVTLPEPQTRAAKAVKIRRAKAATLESAIRSAGWQGKLGGALTSLGKTKSGIASGSSLTEFELTRSSRRHWGLMSLRLVHRSHRRSARGGRAPRPLRRGTAARHEPRRPFQLLRSMDTTTLEIATRSIATIAKLTLLISRCRRCACERMMPMGMMWNRYTPYASEPNF